MEMDSGGRSLLHCKPASLVYALRIWEMPQKPSASIACYTAEIRSGYLQIRSLQRYRSNILLGLATNCHMLQMAGFWVVEPRSLLVEHQGFGVTYCLYLQS
jgi:hypothetical protein